MRIAGLASGMDIDQMVKDLMRAERVPLDKLKQKKQTLEWQRDDYRALNTKLLSFRDKLANLKLTTNYRARTATSSNDAYVSATVTSGAAQASYSISEVKQLASAATLVNAGKISAQDKKIDPTRSLMDQGGNFLEDISWEKGVIESKTYNGNTEIKLDINQLKTLSDGSMESINIKVNGQALVVKMGDDETNLGKNEVLVKNDGTLTFGTPLTKDSVVKVDYVLNEKSVDFTYPDDEGKSSVIWNIGGGAIATASITVEKSETESELLTIEGDNVIRNGESIGKINYDTGTITFTGGISEGEKFSLTYTQNYSSIGINTHTSKGEVNEKIFITGNDSLNNVIRKVNESSAGVTMFYDSFSDKVTFTRKETGKFNIDDADIKVSGQFLEKVLMFNNVDANNPMKLTDGQNAKFTINGLETERNSNTFDMNGVTITLKQTFAEADNIQPPSITISNNTEGVLENIKEFVTQYNELIKEIGGKLDEKRYRDYKPLTDEEREELSEKQQEKWEEMARSGLLRGDSVLSSVLSEMRMDMYSTVETNGLFKQLASIGIKTTANYLEGGKLEIDEAKLKAALEEDPEAVENLFRGNDSEAGKGIVHRLYDTVDSSMKKLQEKAGRATSTNQQFTIGKELDNVDNSIDRFEERMKQVENRYWRQFTAMEKAIQQANQQSTYLMQQFGGY
ncbi:flagellar filament capping protein FliD [Bacillus niameyensis]|uniref:flagellar filament capping protein FliD n=1 Tax=Bacillus niameyensis TaxID=1522308 RepID=UPI0007806E5D|nr:flagellar filament capping protein FliD [Bacillus niameyensis]